MSKAVEVSRAGVFKKQQAGRKLALVGTAGEQFQWARATCPGVWLML